MNPYENLPKKAFWKLAVANKSMFDISELWDPKFHIKPKRARGQVLYFAYFLF